MQPRSEDRYLFYLAAWLEAMDEDGDEVRVEPTSDQVRVVPFHIERITRKSILEHPLLAPRLGEVYEKARA